MIVAEGFIPSVMVVKEINSIKSQVEVNGFAIVEDVLSAEDVDSLLSTINHADNQRPSFRKSNDLFAIRQFFMEIPAAVNKVFTPILDNMLTDLYGGQFFVVKSIYFDKPADSNWFVSYHQDLTISVEKKTDIPGFGPWTTKPGYFAVQPPLRILEEDFTIRIHLDDTNEQNGALKVIPTSHLKGICRPETIDLSTENQVYCNVRRGGIMIMKPLLLHSSGRTTNGAQRRVLHIEFSRSVLPENLYWAERICRLSKPNSKN